MQYKIIGNDHAWSEIKIAFYEIKWKTMAMYEGNDNACGGIKMELHEIKK